MDEGDGVALMDPDFPEETLPEKMAHVVQVVAQTLFTSLMLWRQLSSSLTGSDV